MSLFSTVATNTLWSALSTLGSLLFGLVTSIVLARALGPSVIGQYHYWIWVTGLLVLIASPGPAHAMTKFGAELLGKQDRQTASTLFAWLLLAELALGSLAAGAALLYAWATRSSDPSTDLVAFVIVALSVVPGVVEKLLLAAAKGTQEFRYLSQASLAGNLFYAVCAITAVMLGFGIQALLLALLARRIITILLIGWQLPTYYTVRGALRFAVSTRTSSPTLFLLP